MISILTTALALAAGSTPNLIDGARGAEGAVEGVASVRVDGREMACRGVMLIPRSAGVDAEVRRVFGRDDSGARFVGQRELARRQARRAAAASGTRESRCRNSETESFTFRDVAPGDYYVTAFFAPRVRNYDPMNGFAPRGLDLVRRVHVPAGGTVEVSLRHR